MARQGLMDDTGYHDIDNAEYFAEKYCCRCVNLPIEEKDGQIWVTDCDKDCSLADPQFFEEYGEDE